MQSRTLTPGAAAALAGLAAIGLAASAQAESVLRVVPHADLKVVDPITVTAAITFMHGLMVYDSLLALDASLTPKPQMAESVAISPDRLTYTFTLRPGLKWHDGTAVTASDLVPSLKRWMARAPVGQKLSPSIADLTAPEQRTFVIRLKQPYPLTEYSLGLAGPWVMPAKVAETDAFTNITSTVGSGPFRFAASEWKPGAKVVYEKNPDYVPRAEPPSFFAGGKQVKVDKVEWTIMPDAATAAAALGRGEVDYWNWPSADLVPTLQKNPDVVVEVVFPMGFVNFGRPNALLPPFNNVKARQALAHAFDQREFMQAAYGDEHWWRVCHSYFVCGAPYGSEAGAEPYLAPDLAKAKQLIAESGYKGEKVVVINTKEIPVIGALTTVAIPRMKEIGLNVEEQLVDWGTFIGRIAKKDPISEGGWSFFTTNGTGMTAHHPLTNLGAPMQCDGKNWFGWPCDEKAEQLRTVFLDAPDEAARKAAMATYHRYLMEVQPYVQLGQASSPEAWRKNVSGIVSTHLPVFWNIAKN
jgi:peptide/nickel transport system substrate-binding protein